MDSYIARQPIFDKNISVVGYELLYKSTSDSDKKDDDGDREALTVINNMALSLNSKTLTNGRTTYINFTPELIKKELYTLFSPKDMVIEIDERYCNHPELRIMISKMRKKGYKIAVSGSFADKKKISAIDYFDIVKIDFSNASQEDGERLIKEYSDRKKVFIADKVMTRSDFEKSIECGFHMFQGNFFSEPLTLKGKGIAPIETIYVQILNELNKKEPDFNRLTHMIESDVAMTYKLLKIINVASYYSSFRINSIKQVAVTLGIIELRKWILIVMLEKTSADKPKEILRQSLVRARLYETISKQTGRFSTAGESFLVGMFSMIDALMDCTKEDIVEELAISDEVKDGIMGKNDYYNMVNRIVVSHENAQWNKFDEQCRKNNVLPQIIFEEYYDAIAWIDELTNEIEKGAFI